MGPIIGMMNISMLGLKIRGPTISTDASVSLVISKVFIYHSIFHSILAKYKLCCLLYQWITVTFWF